MEFKQWLTKQVVSAEDLLQWAMKNHRKESDFYEGDLSDRIFGYQFYELKTLPISMVDVDEWETDDDTVAEYQQRMSDDYPPIIFDPKNKSIIDGAHRAKALANMGVKFIKAYVGIRKLKEKL